MKILITGASGMVGKNLIEHSAAKEYELLTPSSKVLNLLDKESVKAYLKIHQPDFIVHAAGRVGGIHANINSPVMFLAENIQIGTNLINTAYQQGIKNLLNISSANIYPSDAQNPLTEEMILQGALDYATEGYGLAKAVSTRLCEYIHREDNSYLYKTVIPCNLYGRHDKFDPKHSHMIPAVIQKNSLAKEQGLKTIDIWGDGLARREFMYAGDLADFIYYAIQNFELMPQNINVGLGHDHTINEYYTEIAKIVGFEGELVHDLSKPIGMKQKLIDDSKLKAFGWQHSTSLQEGLKKTYQYLKEQKKDV